MIALLFPEETFILPITQLQASTQPQGLTDIYNQAMKAIQYSEAHDISTRFKVKSSHPGSSWVA